MDILRSQYSDSDDEREEPVVPKASPEGIRNFNADERKELVLPKASPEEIVGLKRKEEKKNDQEEMARKRMRFDAILKEEEEMAQAKAHDRVQVNQKEIINQSKNEDEIVTLATNAITVNNSRSKKVKQRKPILSLEDSTISTSRNEVEPSRMRGPVSVSISQYPAPAPPRTRRDIERGYAETPDGFFRDYIRPVVVRMAKRVTSVPELSGSRLEEVLSYLENPELDVLALKRNVSVARATHKVKKAKMLEVDPKGLQGWASNIGKSFKCGSDGLVSEPCGVWLYSKRGNGDYVYVEDRRKKLWPVVGFVGYTWPVHAIFLQLRDYLAAADYVC